MSLHPYSIVVSILLACPMLYGEDEYRIPFAVTGEGVPILVHARVKEQSTILLLDTGSTNSSFDVALKESLGPRLGISFGKQAGKPEVSAAHVAPKVMLGEAALEASDFTVCLDDAAHLKKLTGHQIHGVLGMNYLRKWVVTIDFDRSEVVLRHHLSDRDAKGTKIAFTGMRDGRPCIPLSINGSELSALVDLGGIGSLMVENAAFDRIAPKSPHGRIGFYCDRLSVGPLEHSSFLVGPGHVTLVGLYYWNNYRITFDFPNKCMYATPRKDQASLDHSECDGACCEDVGIVNGKKRTVGLCTIPSSPAYKLGLRFRDILVELDGKNVDDLSMLQIDRMWSERGKKALSVRVLRNGTDSDPLNDELVTVEFPDEK
jgi:hypothetical protein